MSVAVLVAAVCDDRGGAAKREGDAVGSSQVANGPVARVVVEEALNVHHDLAARNSGCDGGQGRPGRPVRRMLYHPGVRLEPYGYIQGVGFLGIQRLTHGFRIIMKISFH